MRTPWIRFVLVGDSEAGEEHSRRGFDTFLFAGLARLLIIILAWGRLHSRACVTMSRLVSGDGSSAYDLSLLLKLQACGRFVGQAGAKAWRA